jgi:HEAT repeat protein
MVLVLVFVLFGAVAGKEDSPRENLDRLLRGGFNERKQAAFNLVRQVLVSEAASAAGEEPEWDIDESFLPELRAAREELGEIERPGDVLNHFVLASVMAELGEPEGVARLAEITGLSESMDPQGEYRMYAARMLGKIGPRLAPGVGGQPGERERAAHVLIGLLDDPDPELVLWAIAGLQNLPSEATVPALRGMLTRQALEQRASAALSLAVLGDDAGVPVLREMLALAPYEEERADDARKWPSQRVSESRCKALAALHALGVAPSADELARLTAGEPDPALRRLAAELAAEAR